MTRKPELRITSTVVNQNTRSRGAHKISKILRPYYVLGFRKRLLKIVRNIYALRGIQDSPPSTSTVFYYKISGKIARFLNLPAFVAKYRPLLEGIGPTMRPHSRHCPIPADRSPIGGRPRPSRRATSRMVSLYYSIPDIKFISAVKKL